jgi:hypothetical protein
MDKPSGYCPLTVLNESNTFSGRTANALTALNERKRKLALKKTNLDFLIGRSPSQIPNRRVNGAYRGGDE